MVARPDAFFRLFGTRVSLGDFAGLSVAVTQSVSSEIARHCLLLAEFALSVILIRWWLVTKSSVPVRCLSNVGVVACHAMILSARWTTRLPGYGRLVAILAEARDFQLAAILSGACASSFPPFLWCEAYALWLLWRFRLCGSCRGF